MIFVTGGTGFIGRELVKKLAAAGDPSEVVCMVHKGNTTELERTGRDILENLGVKMIEAELISKAGLEQLKGVAFDAVYHLASCTDTSEPDHSVNTVGTRHLCEALGPMNAKTHFVLTSSIAVNDMREDYNAAIDEDTAVPERPCHEYGREKLMTEKYLITLGKQQGFALSVIRVCGVYGDNVRKGGLFNSLESLALKGSLLSRLNWPGKVGVIYVEDMAEFIHKVGLKRPMPGTNELYIPAIEALSIQEMFQVMYVAHNLPYQEITLPGYVWAAPRFLARRKKMFESILPHRLYNTVWQACLLVNNEFYNKGRRIKEVLGNSEPKQFTAFYKEKARRTQK